MSPTSPRTSVEQRGLLRSTSFEISDADSVERYNKQLNRSENGRFGARRRWKSSSAWLRPRNLLIFFVVALGLIVVGAFWIYQPEKLIQKLKPSAPAESAKSDPILAEPAPIETPSTEIPDLASPDLTSSDLTSSDLTSSDLTSHQTPNPTSAESPNSISIEKPKPTSAETPDSKTQDSKAHKFDKPKEFKIIGLVFFGRPPVVAILDCYLKKNLVSNGGFLDEVLWAVNTKEPDHLHYLDELVKTSERYKKVEMLEGGYKNIWANAVEDGPMYIKIDDDMVYLSDDAIPNIVYTKLNHPESLDVVANLVNSPETGWLHYHVGAVHAYLPELEPPPPDTDSASYGPKAWRASALPEWNEKGEMSFHVADKPDDGSNLEIGSPGAPPYKNHRWLPLPGNNDTNLHKTPMSLSRYDPYGPDWTSWALAAQVHYSLLENIEKNQLNLYYYGSGLDDTMEGIWNMNYERMNINVMAIWGKDVKAHAPFPEDDDEAYLSQVLTKELGRPLIVNTHAVAAHLSFRTQHEIYETDLLSRYRAYANEMICTKDNQIATSDPKPRRP